MLTVRSQSDQDFHRYPVLFLSLTSFLGEYSTFSTYNASLREVVLNNHVPHFLSVSTTVTQSRESHKKEVNVFKHAVRIHIFFSFSREWRDGVLTVLLRRQAKELRLQETANTKTSGKPLMKWLHLDGTVICSF